jgi:hypothetical protein
VFATDEEDLPKTPIIFGGHGQAAHHVVDIDRREQPLAMGG